MTVLRTARPKSHRVHRALTIAATVTLLAACVPKLPAAVVAQPSTAPVATASTAAPIGPMTVLPELAAYKTTVISGTVIAPAGIIAAGGGNIVSAGGGNIVSAGGGNIVSAGGGNIVSAGGGNYQLLALSEAPLANCKVFLADASGKPFPDLPAVVTNAAGEYAIKDVPPGFTFMVVADCETTGGKKAPLKTLTKSSENPTGEVSIGAATTLVAITLVEGLGGSMGAFNQETFKKAIVATSKNLTEENLPDLSNDIAVKAEVVKLSSTVVELKDAVGSLKQDIQILQKSLDDLMAELGKRNASVKAIAERAAKQPPPPGQQPPFPGQQPPLGPDGRPLPPPPGQPGGDGKPPLPGQQPPLGPDGMPMQDPQTGGPPPCDQFDMYDAFVTKDGQVSLKELGFRGQAPVDLPDIFMRADRDNSKGLSRLEFCENLKPPATTTLPTTNPTPGTTQTPGTFDCIRFLKEKDGNFDGKLEPKEMYPAPLTEQNFLDFKNRDTNHDQFIDQVEICQVPGTVQSQPTNQPTATPQPTSTTTPQPTSTTPPPPTKDCADPNRISPYFPPINAVEVYKETVEFDYFKPCPNGNTSMYALVQAVKPPFRPENAKFFLKLYNPDSSKPAMIQELQFEASGQGKASFDRAVPKDCRFTAALWMAWRDPCGYPVHMLLQIRNDLVAGPPVGTSPPILNF